MCWKEHENIKQEKRQMKQNRDIFKKKSKSPSRCFKTASQLSGDSPAPDMLHL